MTREEAIKELSEWLNACCGAEEIEPTREALRMAIEALKAQLSQEGTTSDTISRQAALDIFDDYNISVENGDLEAYSRDRKRLCDLPSAHPEPCEDTVSRQAIFNTAAEYEKQLCEILGDENELVEVAKILKHRLIALPSAQPEITDGQAVEHLQASGWMQNHDKQMYEMGLRERLADDSDSYDALLPSAQPQHWIDKTDPEWDGEWGDWQCPHCGAIIMSMAINLNGVYLYCPKCGEMVDGER